MESYGAAADSVVAALPECRTMAAGLNASGFGVYACGQSLEGLRLTPVFDSDFPRLAAFSLRVAGAVGEEMARHARVSTIPCCWMSGDAAPVDALDHLDWVALTSTLVPAASGIAFPVQCETDAGVVIFHGPRMILDADRILDAHACCFRIFSAVARSRRSTVAPLPAVSRRELECLRLTADGHTSEDIARLLNLSVHTANQYLTRITQKLDAMNRVHAVAKALRLGLIE